MSVRKVVVITLFAGLVAAIWRPVHASLFGEENATLLQQLVQLIQIRQELEVVSGAAEHGAEVAGDIHEVYRAAQAGVDELKSYTTDRFLGDLKADLYSSYPGFEVLLEGAGSRQVRRWKDSRASSPFTTYEMIGAVFGDITQPLRRQAESGELSLDRAYIHRYEGAGALALAHRAEVFTKSADEDAEELYRLAETADADQAEHLSARALSLIAVQNSHIIRLLSREVRLDGIRSAMKWANSVEGAKSALRDTDRLADTMRRAAKPPTLMTFEAPW